MPKRPPGGPPHLPGGGPGPGPGKPGTKPGPTTGPATLATPQPSLSGGGGTSGGGAAGGAPDSNPELLVRGSGPNPEWVIRDFTAGMHCNPSRDAIPEQDLWWLENLQPLASGNMVSVTVSGPIGASDTGQPVLPFYSATVFNGGVPAIFAAFPDGSGWLQNVNSSGIMTEIMPPGTLSTTAGSVAVATYTGSTAGFLIISKTGYWDYGVTSPNTLTSLSGGISSSANSIKNTVGGGTALKQITTGGGTGGVFQAHYQVIGASINAAGTGYNPGDVLSLTDNNPVTAAQITVASTTGAGVINTIQLTLAGDYPGPTTSALVNTGPSGNTVTGGGGTGATFHITIQAFKLVIVSAGAGWTGSPTVTDETGVPVVIDKWNLTIGLTQGTSIAVYAGRVWIGYLNTLSYTDVNQYNSFANAGGTSTFSDSYLGGEGITALYSANNYLYIFANAAIDVLSNVTVPVATGLTSFSRVNVLQGLGVSHFATMSITGFARGVSFMDTSGYYLLAGATPERISDRWQAVVRTIPPTSLVSAAVFNLNNELCLGVLCTFVDTFSQVGPQTRVCVFVYQRHRWWVYSPQYFSALSVTSYGPLIGVPNSGLYNAFNFPLPTLFLWGLQNVPTHALILQAFISSNLGAWTIRTKLWDGAAAHREKQPINVALGVIYNNPFGQTPPTISFTVDTEGGSSSTVPLPTTPNNAAGYFLSVFKGLANQTSTQAFPTVYGAQYIGLTITSPLFITGTQSLTVESLALRGKQERNILE